MVRRLEPWFLPPFWFSIKASRGGIIMSAERMMVNAMQEQPILLLPMFMLIYLIKHFLRQFGGAVLTHNTYSTRLPQ
jgi:predicted benzoate:H+ symporter BenE